MKIRKKEQHESNALLYIVLIIAIVVTVSIMAVLIASVSTHVDAQTQPPVQNDVTLTFIERDVAYRVPDRVCQVNCVSFILNFVRPQSIRVAYGHNFSYLRIRS